MTCFRQELKSYKVKGVTLNCETCKANTRESENRCVELEMGVTGLL